MINDEIVRLRERERGRQREREDVCVVVCEREGRESLYFWHSNEINLGILKGQRRTFSISGRNFFLLLSLKGPLNFFFNMAD